MEGEMVEGVQMAGLVAVMVARGEGVQTALETAVVDGEGAQAETTAEVVVMVVME